MKRGNDIPVREDSQGELKTECYKGDNEADLSPLRHWLEYLERIVKLVGQSDVETSLFGQSIQNSRVEMLRSPIPLRAGAVAVAVAVDAAVSPKVDLVLITKTKR